MLIDHPDDDLEIEHTVSVRVSICVRSTVTLVVTGSRLIFISERDLEYLREEIRLLVTRSGDAWLIRSGGYYTYF